MAAKQKVTTKAQRTARASEDKQKTAEATTQFTVSSDGPKPDPERAPVDMQAMPEYGRGRAPEPVESEDGEETPDKKWTQASKARWGFGDGANIADLNRESIEIDQQIAKREAGEK